MQEKKRASQVIVPGDLFSLLISRFGRGALDWNEMNLLSAKFRSYFPTLNVREEALGDAKFNRAQRATQPACQHQQQRKNCTDDQPVWSFHAVIGKGVSENQAQDTGVSGHQPMPLAPQSESRCKGRRQYKDQHAGRIGAALGLHIRTEDQRNNNVDSE